MWLLWFGMCFFLIFFSNFTLWRHVWGSASAIWLVVFCIEYSLGPLPTKEFAFGYVICSICNCTLFKISSSIILKICSIFFDIIMFTKWNYLTILFRSQSLFYFFFFFYEKLYLFIYYGLAKFGFSLYACDDW